MKVTTLCSMAAIIFAFIIALSSCKKSDMAAPIPTSSQWTFRDTLEVGILTKQIGSCGGGFSCFGGIYSDDASSDELELDFFPKLPTKNGVYTIIDGTTSGDSTQCNLYLQNSSTNGLPPFQNFKSVVNSGKKVSVTVTRGNITCTFANVPMISDPGSSTGILSGTLVYTY